MKKLLILFVLLTLGFLNTQAQERNVIWAHGLNDDADFWNDEFARAQRDFQIRSHGNTHPTN